MSGAEPAVQHGATTDSIKVPTLDISKLHSLPSEQQDLFLLTFVSDLRRTVEKASNDALSHVQQPVTTEIIKIVGLGAPTPSRIIRNALAKSLGDAFGRGSRRTLYETIHELLAFINAGKSEKELGPKHVAVVCMGELFYSAGDSAISLSALVVQSLVRVLKVAHNGLRASVFRSLALIVNGVRSSLDEHIARDIWRSARNAATGDKSALVQKYAFLCLKALVTRTPFFNNSNDWDTLKTTAWKTCDCAVPAARHAVADTLAAALVQAFSEVGTSETPLVRKPKKSSKKAQNMDDEEEIERPSSASGNHPKPVFSLTLTLSEVLRTLSIQFTKPSTNNRVRAAIASCYKALFQSLPSKVMESEFGRIAEHLYYELLNHHTIMHNRHRLLLTRRLVQGVLKSVVDSGILTENAQINAARYLINNILKNYPQVMAEKREPSKRVLIGALDTLSQLLERVGSAASILQDSCREALSLVMQHPSYTVQCYAAKCLKIFILSCPGQLTRSIDYALSQLRKDLNPTAESRHNFRKCGGYAKCIAAMLNAAREKPLFGSTEQFSQIFSYSTELLKLSANSELRLSATQVQVAWTLLGGLMNLGPNFVKVHLNQLLLLWRNALPPPLTRENAAQRGQLELSFLSHVRECALTGLLIFLDACSSLVTTDGSRRISIMLQNTVQFVESLPQNRQTEDVALRLVPALQLQDFVFMLRRRLLQCFTALVDLKQLDRTDILSHSDLVGLTMRIFTSPDRPVVKSLEASLATSASTFEGLWEASDGWGFGVASLIQGINIFVPAENSYEKARESMYTIEAREDVIDDSIYLPSLPALEHDAALLYRPGTIAESVELSSTATTCINASIKLFAVVLPLQSARVQESCIEQLTTMLAQPFQREPGKKAALQVNSALALLFALSVANNETSFSAGKLHLSKLGKTLSDILKGFLADADIALRSIAARALGILCNLAGTQVTNNEVKSLIDNIVANRDPHTRAGCALALGYVHSEVGAMAASLHIKSIVGVLLSLCSDTHPVVHFWALRGLALVADSAGLSFTTYATSTLGMMAQLYSSDSHNDESASLTTSNLELEFSTPLAVAQCIDCIINVLGPDLQDSSKSRNLILTLISHLQSEDYPALQYQSYACLAHIWMYAPAHVQYAKYVQDLQRNLASGDELLKTVAISGLSDLMKKSSSEVARVAPSTLSDDLWTNLDERPANIVLQTMIRNWMQQTVMTEAGEWVNRCQTVLSKTRTRNETQPQSVATKSAMPDLADEEVAGFATTTHGESTETSTEGQEFLRWQTRYFAMCLLSEILQIVQDAILPDQILPAEDVLQGKVAEIIRIAFSASTANVIELRIWGLRIIDQILKMFGKTPDPDFLEASLLEQYQAQIGSALTPAFSVDSSPELAAEAVAVCATFAATGIVTNADRMGRIFKVLSNGVENLTQPTPEASIGDLKNLSPNAQSMLRMAILSGWAQLELFSVEQPYLEEMLLPFISKLAPLWLNSLQEFAGLRFEPEISDSLGGDVVGANIDERYASFNREIRLPFYQQNWLSIVNAIAVLVEKDSEAVFDALDKKQATPNNAVNGTEKRGKDMSFREEPVAFFFILFGLAFEALVTRAREDPTQALSILHALKKILTPAVSGNSIYENVVFNETTDTLDRLALTSTSSTQSTLIDIARNMSLDHPSAKQSHDRDDKLSDDIEQLFELTRIIVLVLTGVIPTLEDPPSAAFRRLTDDNIALVQLSFQALVDVADVFPAIIRADLHACIFHCYCTILATGICQDEVVPTIMPVFRAFLQDTAQGSINQTLTRLVRGSLHQMLTVLSVAQRRENEFSLTCAKNTLLSITVLLTTSGLAIPPNDKLITRAIAEILDCLQDVGLAKIAASCIRTLLLTKPKTPCDETVVRILWPKLILFVCDQSAEDPENVKTMLVQSLVGSVTSLRLEGQQSAMAILIPVLLSRASHAMPNGSKEDIRKECAARVLEMAGTNPIAFRVTVGSLDETRRNSLESLLRLAGVGRKQEVDSDENGDSKPAIALRMDL